MPPLAEQVSTDMGSEVPRPWWQVGSLNMSCFIYLPNTGFASHHLDTPRPILKYQLCCGTAILVPIPSWYNTTVTSAQAFQGVLLFNQYLYKVKLISPL